MKYKRLELYVWWTCNQKCTYCKEFANMEKSWSKKVTKYDILKKLIKYKKQWYNHVTYLWWEPFIQPVFLDALILAKKLWYTILVTTNCTTLHIEKEAKKYLSFIDELILSVEAIDKELQQKISRTKVFVYWDKVFENIKKYWNWNYLKVNIVITKDNLSKLFNIVKYIKKKGVNNIAITYPDLDDEYYWKKHLLERVAPTYSESILEVIKINDFCVKNNINLKIVDFPFCIFPKNNLKEYINKTDDYDYEYRVKIDHNNKKLDRSKLNDNRYTPRERLKWKKCKSCKYNDLCWWYSRYYNILYWLSEIKTIL